MDKAVDLSSFVENSGDGVFAMTIAVEGVHCGGCIGRIERHVEALPGIVSARLNLTSRRLAVRWTGETSGPLPIFDELERIGFKGHPFRQRIAEAEDAKRASFLLRCLGVAGFAAMNVMLLSVSVWSGEGGDISPETRDLFHWLSALIALPAAAYAGRPFFESAWAALKSRALNMDVPISLGVILALSMSVFETVHHAEHAYFDSALMLLFFLLCGRYLDHLMRKRTRSVAATLAAMKGEMAHRLAKNGEVIAVAASDLVTGDSILLRPGDKVPADIKILTGESLLDEAIVTGETSNRTARAGDHVYAGSLIMDGALTAIVTAAGSGTLIDEVERLLDKAALAKSAYVQLADKAARLYAPVVHVTAALTCAGWLLAGHSLHDAIIAAIAVLIITCPCALALAVPAVQVVATGGLFRRGVLLNSGDALERMAKVDTIVFDKTGTLTMPEPHVTNAQDVPEDMLTFASRLALSSRHPLARALACESSSKQPLEGAVEETGQGVKAVIGDVEAQLGSLDFCGIDPAGLRRRDANASLIGFRWGDKTAVFTISQRLRPDAVAAIRCLRERGFQCVILSGDRIEAVSPVAKELSIEEWLGGCKPADKIAYIERLKANGRSVMMVGDGLNDAPALAAANVSMSPITATDLTQAQADAVFLGDRLGPIVETISMASRALALMKQNLGLAVIYNAVAVPLAIAGFVTPLIAAVAMSGSSMLVTLNALRTGQGVESAPDNAIPTMRAIKPVEMVEA